MRADIVSHQGTKRESQATLRITVDPDKWRGAETGHWFDGCAADADRRGAVSEWNEFEIAAWLWRESESAPQWADHVRCRLTDAEHACAAGGPIGPVRVWRRIAEYFADPDGEVPCVMVRRA